MPGRRAAVLGRPIGHSLSPVLHRAAYAALGLDWSYEALDCGVAELPALLVERAEWAGFSCTMPLKHAALELAVEAGPEAELVGAANTLRPRAADGWRADNTDVDGVRGALKAMNSPTSATVLGAGGTAQAVVIALGRLGVTECSVLVREPARADALRATADRTGMRLTLDRLSLDAEALRAELIISTLPPGTADGLASAAWRKSQTVLDVVYDKWPTPLAAAASAAGARTVSGASVLLYQAAAQVELMTGRPAPVDQMRAALVAAAPECGL